MSNSSNKPITVTTSTFENEVIESDMPVVIDFWAPWCGPCRAIGPVLDKLAGEWAGKVKVVKVNVDEEPSIAGAFRVASIPTIAAMNGREVVDVQIGFGGAKALETMFSKLAKKYPVAAV